MADIEHEPRLTAFVDLITAARQLSTTLHRALDHEQRTVVDRTLARKQPLLSEAGLLADAVTRVVDAGSLVEAAALLLEDGFARTSLAPEHLAGLLNDALRRYGLRVVGSNLDGAVRHADDIGPDLEG